VELLLLQLLGQGLWPEATVALHALLQLLLQLLKLWRQHTVELLQAC
jgi:hypothetical protein